MFQNNNLPTYKAIYPSMIIQHSKSKNHFRLLKIKGKERMEIIDDDKTLMIND